MRILITGASGSGQSTLAVQLSGRTGYEVLDGDDFLWIPSDPPYVNQRSVEERHDLLFAALQKLENVIVSGSIMGWGDTLERCFDLIVFLYVPTPTRMQRLVARETARFGKIDPEFEEWASQYELPETEGRSLHKHQEWLASRDCAVLRIEEESSPQESADVVVRFLALEKGRRTTPKALPDGFESNRLIARPYLPRDFEAFLEAVLETIEELRLWPDALPWVKEEQTLESAERFFTDREERRRDACELAYLLFEKKTQVMVGALGLHQIDWEQRTAVVGAWSRTSMRGAGYMTEALEAVLSQAAHDLGLTRVEAHTNEANAKSRKLLERFGFTLQIAEDPILISRFCVYTYSLSTVFRIGTLPRW